MIQTPELEFTPELNIVCYLLDHPVFIIIAIVAILSGYVFNILPTPMIVIGLISLILLFMQFIKYSRTCGETEVTVYNDRIEIEVGMKEPKITMIEFSNFKKIETKQTYFQKKFQRYSLVITYNSDFTSQDITYLLRDFKEEDQKNICAVIKKTAANDALARRKADEKRLSN